ncbi:MAG: hypothetical protein LUD53_07585 [Clostridiales bacterium]|nr:hypothetical protein [Clostridiales bacterium]
MLARAYLKCAVIRSDSESSEYDLEEAREILLEALQILPADNTKTAQLLQKLIDTDMKLANQSADNAGTASVYRQEAIEKLRLVEENGWATFNTYNNLIVLYQKEGNLEEAEAVLEEIAEEYAADYRWYKRYAFLEIAKQQELETQEQDYSVFAEYYGEAMALYEEYLNAGNEADGEMDTLQAQYENAERAGWFSESEGADDEVG